MNHLIATDYYRLIEDLIDKLCFKNIDIVKMDFSTSTISQIVEEASYSSLFDEYKNIVVYNANIFGSAKCDEKDLDMLTSYIKNPNPKTCLIFVCGDKLDNRKKITKLLKDNNSIIDYKKVSYYDLIDLTEKYIKKNKWKINKDIINYVIKSSNNNYDIICCELDKMMLCYSENPSLDDAKKIISTSISDSVYKFVDAVTEQNIALALKTLEELRIYKIDPVVILISLFKTFKQMLFYKIAIKNNLDMKMVFYRDNLQEWQLKKIANSSNNYSLNDIISIIHLISKYDFEYKSGLIDKDVAINTFLLELS